MTCTSRQSCFIFCGYSCAKKIKCPRAHWALMLAKRQQLTNDEIPDTRYREKQSVAEDGRGLREWGASLSSGHGDSCWEDDMSAVWRWRSWARAPRCSRQETNGGECDGSREDNTQKWGDEVRQMGEVSRGQINHGGWWVPCRNCVFHWETHKMFIVYFEQVRGMIHLAFRMLIRWLSWEEGARETRKSRDTREAIAIK